MLQTMEEATDMPVPEALKDLVPAGERCCTGHRAQGQGCVVSSCVTRHLHSGWQEVKSRSLCVLCQVVKKFVCTLCHWEHMHIPVTCMAAGLRLLLSSTTLLCHTLVGAIGLATAGIISRKADYISIVGLSIAKLPHQLRYWLLHAAAPQSPAAAGDQTGHLTLRVLACRPLSPCSHQT